MWIHFTVVSLVMANLCIFVAANTDCKNRFITKDDVIYVLSEQPATGQEAKETCQSYGGRLAQISNQEERQSLEPHLQTLYMPDSLTNITIWIDSTKLYIFLSSGGTRKSVPNGYVKPRSGQLNRITLYNKNSIQGFNQPLTFCRFDNTATREHRDVIFFMNGCPGFDWSNNFLRYGGNSQTNETIPVYDKQNDSGRGTRSILSLNETATDIIYIPDICVFIGSRSHYGQSHWTWNNGTMVADTSNFPSPDSSVCEQMTWPLTYDDGINLRAKDCSKETHYVCRVDVFRIRAILKVECDETSLRLSILNSDNGTFPGRIIQITNSNTTIMSIAMNSSATVIGNLTRSTNYSFQLRPYFQGCAVGPTVTVTERTGYGVPDRIASAAVIYSTSTICLISWRKVQYEDEEIYYKITSTSNVTENSTTVQTSSLLNQVQRSDEFIEYDIDLSSHGHNNTVTFQIQAVSSCGKLSETLPVTGACISPMKRPTAEEPPPSLCLPASTIGIIVGIITPVNILILALVFFVKYRNKSNQQRNSVMKSSETIMEPTIYERPIATEPTADSYVQPNTTQEYENIKQERHNYDTVKSSEYENLE